MKLIAIPNANDTQMFDLVKEGTTPTVWACIMKDMLWDEHRQAFDALQRGERVTIEIIVS